MYSIHSRSYQAAYGQSNQARWNSSSNNEESDDESYYAANCRSDKGAYVAAN